MTVTAEYIWTAKQLQFIRSTKRYVLYAGSRGSLKTRALCAWAVERAGASRHAVVGLCRLHLTDLRATVLKELLEDSSATVKAVLPPQNIENHNKMDRVIKLKRGGQIHYFGIDEEHRLGLNLTHLGIDEAAQLTREMFDAINLCVRLPVDPNNTTAFCTNPRPPNHWLAKFMGIGGTLRPDGEFIKTNKFDIPPGWVSPAFLESLETLTGANYKRMALGEWVGSDRLVFAQFGDDYIRERAGPWDRCIFGYDWGFSPHPAALVVIVCDGEGKVHIPEVWRKTDIEQAEQVTIIKGYSDKYRPERIYCDPSNPNFISSLRTAGMPAVEANNKRIPGVNNVRDFIRKDKRGKPLFTVGPMCSDLIDEMYSWEALDTASGQEDFVKVGEDLCSALRYGMMALATAKPDAAAPWAPDDANVAAFSDAEFADLAGAGSVQDDF